MSQAIHTFCTITLFVHSFSLTCSMLPFDLDLTLSCGQIFGWKKAAGAWSGVYRDRILTIVQKGTDIFYEGCEPGEIAGFLGLDDDPVVIITSIRRHMQTYGNVGEDPFFEQNIQFSQASRIMRQDPWECLVSFICSANSNIPLISRRIGLLMERFGEEIRPGYNLFPDPEALSESPESVVRECLAGYRAPYLQRTAGILREDPDFLSRLVSLEYKEAKKRLMTLPGVGPKVADCVLLFAYHRLEAVPVDVRIRRIITIRYLDVPEKDGLGEEKEYSYDEIADFCRAYFGPYAGYAQQYLFAARDETYE